MTNKTHGVNIPSVNEVEVSRRLRHEGEETPSHAPMCENGHPYRSRQNYRSPGYPSLFFVLDGSGDIVENVISLIVGDSRVLLRRIVHEKVPEAVPARIRDKSYSREELNVACACLLQGHSPNYA